MPAIDRSLSDCRYAYVYTQYEYPSVVRMKQAKGDYSIHDTPVARGLEGLFWVRVRVHVLVCCLSLYIHAGD